MAKKDKAKKEEDKKKDGKAEEKTEDKKDAKKEEKAESEKKEGGEAQTGEEKEGEAAAEGEPKKSKKKLIIIIVAAILVLGGVGGGAAFFFLGGKEHKEEEIDPNKVAQIIYYDMEEFLVNLNNPDRQVSFLKMTVTLELPNLAAKAAVEAKLPRIRDSFQVYLRELRNTDLQGSAGVQRLKEELLLRINKILDPEKVNDILFKEIIVQ